jgi:hypothetical protein
MRKIISPFSDYISGLDSKKLAIICVILIWIVYINSLGVYFIWDDYSSIVSNANIRNWSIKNIFKPMYQDDSSNILKSPLYFRPIQILSYILDYQVWKLNPFGYHITNVILHTANAVLLYLLFLSLFNDSFFAFLGSALFGTNPIFTSSVTYISGRADILLLLFAILSILYFIKSIKENKLRPFYYGASLFCFICVLFSKEIGIICLTFLFLIDKLIYKYSITITKNLIYLPYIMLMLLYQEVKPSSVLGWHITFPNMQNFIVYSLTIIKGISIYFLLAIMPFNLHMGRSIAIVNSFMDKWSYISIIFLIITIALFIFGIRKNKLFLVGLLWFFLPLFITLLFNNLFARRANEILLPEHNLYFAYPGLLILFFSIFPRLKTKLDIKRTTITLLLCLILPYMVLTVLENNRWQDEIGFYKRIIGYNKNSVFNFLTYANLGYAYEKVKKFQQAEQYFIKAAGFSEGDPYFYNTLANFYLRNRDIDKALNILNFSKSLDINFPQTYSLLGIAYMLKGETEEAKHNFKQVLLMEPNNKIAQYYLELLKDKQ